MKTCLFYGNCQKLEIEKLLKQTPEFSSVYEIIDFPPVYSLSEQDIVRLNELVPTVDLLVHQPVSPGYMGVKASTNFLKTILKETAKSISFPVAFFTGYNPELFRLKDKTGAVVKTPFPWHDRNVLKCYLDGKSAEETQKATQNPEFYNTQNVAQNLQETLTNLAQREAALDIKLSNFIRDNFKDLRLFHTFNHPTQLVTIFVTNSILGILGMPQRDVSYFSQNGTAYGLDFLSPAIYPSVAASLELNFSYSQEYRWGEKFLPVQAMIAEFFSFYDKNPQVVDGGLERCVERG